MTAYADFSFASTSDLANLGGPASRFNHNVTAIKLLKSLETEGRAHGDLTPDEQRTLTRYSGWGDGEVLNRLFPYGAYSQAPIHPELDGALTIEERGKITASSLNAHYTALPIIGAIYEALSYLGIGALDSLRVLEPAAGIGHFFGVMPTEIAAKAERVAVELDWITARILQYLYPNAKVFNQGFEESTMPNDYFDLVISNIPFGNYAVHDPRIKERYLKAAIHDYYFARSLKLVKPGGIIAFITSRYTLDKVDLRVRRHIAERADLLAAARLPESAFRKNAGTEVVTDVLILRRKYKSGGVEEKTCWLETDVFPNELDYRVPVNWFYIERPDLMLGVPGCSRGMYSDCEFTLKPDGRHLASVLRDSLISQLPYQAITAAPSQPSMLASALMPSLMENALEKDKASAVNLDRLSGISRHRASLLLDIYSAAKQVIRLQLLDAGDEKLTCPQRELNGLYSRFTARYGPINAKQNLKDLDRRSPIVPFLKALEEPTGKGAWKRAAIFHSRTIRPHKDYSHISSPKDALFFCLNECGRVDLDRIEEMGIAHFDAWVQLFAETSQGLEMKPDASGFRIATRFNKFTNLPELAALWRQVLDVKNADQINLPRPKIAGGAPQVITIPATPEIKQFIKKLAARVEAIKSRRVSPDVDNMLRITTEGRKAALDIRLVAPDAPPPAYSKIDALADKVLQFYRLSQKDRGAQVVFCDLVNCRPLA